MFNRLLTILSVLVVLFLVSACGATEPTNAPAPTEAPQEETSAPAEEADSAAEAPAESVEETEVSTSQGVLRLPYPLFWGGKDNLDPTGPVLHTVAGLLLYERLVRFDDEGQVAPSLATAWEANEDATVWTFSLREGVTFHDGQPFGSADVAYTFERIIAPDSESPIADTLSIIETIETPSDSEIRFTLNQAHADLPLLLTSYVARIIPNDSGDTIAETGIGTGPFKLETLDVEGTTVLVANEAYWGGRPKLAKVDLTSIPEMESQTAALLAGQLDMMLNVGHAQVPLFESNSEFRVLTFPSGEWTTVVMRTDTPPFDDARVRKAMRLVADRQAMIDLVLAGNGTISCDTPVSKVDVYRWETDCPQNIEQAKALLAEAGYPDGLDVTLYTSDIQPQYIPLAEVYQQQAKAAGINVTIEVTPADGYYVDVWMVEPFSVSHWLARPADLILNLAWHSESSWNESHYKNPEFDQLLAEARTELDFEARKAKYQQAQQILFEDGGHLIPFHMNLNHVVKANLSGVEAKNYREFEWHLISKTE